MLQGEIECATNWSTVVCTQTRVIRRGTETRDEAERHGSATSGAAVASAAHRPPSAPLPGPRPGPPVTNSPLHGICVQSTVSEDVGAP